MRHEPDIIITEHDGSQWVPLDCYNRLNNELKDSEQESGGYWARLEVVKDELSLLINTYHTTKHNRDVELTDLLAELAERYQDILRPYDLERIKKLVKDD